MSKGTFTCANIECGKTRERSTHNQRYCDSECCRVATNRRIKEKYHENKVRMGDRDRRCDRCGTKMSMYNMDYTCGPCQQNIFITYNKEIMEYLGVTDGVKKV